MNGKVGDREVSRRESVNTALTEAGATQADGSRPSALDTGISLASILNLPGPTDQQFAEMEELLEEHFMRVSDITWRMLRAAVLQEQWSGADLERAVLRVLTTKTWIAPGDNRPRWQLGDILKQPAAKVYSHAWYVSQITPPTGSPSNRDLIGMYQLPESYSKTGLRIEHKKPVFGWKAEVRDTLSPFVAYPVAESHRLRDGRPSMSEDTRNSLQEFIRETREEADAEEERREIEARRNQEVAALSLESALQRDTIRTLNHELEEQQQENDRLRREVEMLRLQSQ